MGLAKAEMMRQEELEPFYEWLEDNYDEGEVGEEGTETWEKAFQAFVDYYDKKQQEEEDWYRQEQIEWYIHTQTQKGIFDTQMKSVLELLNIQASSEAQFSLLVMLHGHTVASVESYLASTFIHTVTNSNILIKKLVETDPVFSNMKFTMKEIFEKQEKLKFTVASYLKDLIFHDLKKVKPMFNDVLDCDFGDITWLYKAVATRHHCVHRAGLDKDGDRVDISVDSIKRLISSSKLLVQEVENTVSQIPDSNSYLF